ncbi:MAG: hypothetical protein AAFV95_02960 [Bacteroidota bacterium]
MSRTYNCSLLVFLLCCSFSLCMGQTQEHKIAMSTGKLIVEEINKVNFESHSGNEVIISYEGEPYKLPERAQGLRSISASGKQDNTQMGLNVKRDGDKATISSVSKKRSKRYLIKVPKGVSIYYEHSTYNGGKINFHNLPNEIEVDAHYNPIYLENTTGPVAISTVYGKIEAVFQRLSKEHTVKLYSVYQLVDVTLPRSIAADVKLSSSYGEMFTNFEFDSNNDKDKMKNLSKSKISGTINGGGTLIDITSTYQNIYLRKAE